MWKPTAAQKYRMRMWLTSDETGLIILGILGFARGISYFPPLAEPNRPPAHTLEHLLSPPAWGILWALAGLGCIVAVVWKRTQPAAVGVMVGMHFLWAISFATVGGRGWVSAISYLCVFALAFWAFTRGRREPHLVRGDPPKIDGE